MTEEEDIKRFADYGDFLSETKEFEVFAPISDMTREITDRSKLYIEFMAAAFMKETGLPASECELVFEQLHSFEKITLKWYFRKRESANSQSR